MHLSRLDLFALRNLAEVRLQCNPHSNILFGQNGSGKTSLLEGLSLLSRARSFRQRDPKTLINYEAQELVVSARCEPAAGAEFSQPFTLGIKRPRTGSAQARHNGQPVASALDLSSLLPLQIIEPQSFSLLEGGPLQRRQFIDWGVFHVEQGYKSHWRAYQRGLKQRNELLRRGRISDELLAPWSAIIAEHGAALGQFREEYLAALAPLVTEQLSRFGALGEVALVYQPGWSLEYANLLEALEASQDRDRRRGMTTVGPHRGELRVLVAGRVASEVLSRGEIKLLVYALKLAQAQLYAHRCGEPCVLAIDDLPAELDYRHRGEVLAAVAALQGQSFITGVDRADFSPFHQEIGSASMFHVEHGAVTAERE
ncbi:MAG: DNA replication/repair protein RecF [Porticoccaceae bacterium]